MSPPDAPSDQDLANKIVEVFRRIAAGDLTARLPRTLLRDKEDAIAFFIEVVADQLTESQRLRNELEVSLTALIEKFIAMAAGDFTVRGERNGRGDAIDTLTYLLNNVAVEVGGLVSHQERQRKLLETVIESMVDGVLLLDAEGRIRRANAAMAKLLGHDADALVGVYVGELLGPTERSLAARLAEQLPEGPFSHRETLFQKADGSALTMTLSGAPHRDSDSELVGVVLVARDEREFKHMQAHLHLSERLATVGTLAAGVAHEINNPLGFVSANVDFVLEEMEDVAAGGALTSDRIAEIVRALRSSRGGANRVRQIVRDLLLFARSDAEAVTRVELNSLLDSSISLIGNEIRHHARLTKKYGTPPPVLANEGRLVQVFLNLIKNAVQAIPIGAADLNEITIVTGTERDQAFVEVHDTGCGIPAENLPRLFDLFYTTKPVGVGTGLGLSIALRLVEKAGGRIEVRSDVGVGTVMRVVLPATRETAPAATAAASKRRKKPIRSMILVVDDEEEVGQSVRRILGRDHLVDIASKPSDALALLTARSYHVILCDLLMPDMTGMDLHALLAKTQPEVAERMVFMTGGAFSTRAREFMATVPNHFFEKPFDAESLRAVLERATNQKPTRKPSKKTPAR